MKQITDDVDFLEFLGLEERQYIAPASNFADRVRDRFRDGVIAIGETLPWQKTHDRVRLRPGEVSLWAGINGHGKSLILGQVLLWLRSNVLIASLEMKPEATLSRMVRQALGHPNPTDQYISQFFSLTENLWIYDQTDTSKPERILGMCYYAAKELGVNHIMLDSLMKCGIAPDDYPRQKDFVDRLCWCAKANDIHIHLVHHVRKSEREGKEPDKFDIKGAGEIADLVDNVFIPHRNKDKERKTETGKPVEKMMPDETVMVAKQRHGEWEGKIALWFHKPSTQFVSGPDSPAMPWRVETRYPEAM